jgi:putative inorganic carbon (HCO3(-)) transporter
MRMRSPSWPAVLGAAAMVAIGVLAIMQLAALPTGQIDRVSSHYVPLVAAVGALSIAIVVWWVEPAYTLSAAVVLTPFAGNWPAMGVPGPLSPDRLLLAGGIAAVLLRAPAIADRPRLRISGVHGLLGLAVVYALGSAFVAGTLLQREPFLKLVDAFGIMPFLLFVVAPLAFRTERQRQVLLASLVALGAYLSLTVLFEATKLDALVYPKYILDPTYGIHLHRGRGPFADAVASGVAIYACGVACAIAVGSWRDRIARAVAIGVGALCVVGVLLCLERSVWIGAILGTTVAMLAARNLRRFFLPMAVTVAIVVGAALVLIPGLSASVTPRVNQGQSALWDRKNLARAAINMVDARPLFGFGWNGFSIHSDDYFQQAFDYPLTATKAGVHNTPLNYAVDLGLVGATLWALGLLFGVGAALVSRGPPELDRWRIGLLAIATAYLVVMNAVPPTTWLNRTIWLLAGVVYSGRYAWSWSGVAPLPQTAHAR